MSDAKLRALFIDGGSPLGDRWRESLEALRETTVSLVEVSGVAEAKQHLEQGDHDLVLIGPEMLEEPSAAVRDFVNEAPPQVTVVALTEEGVDPGPQPLLTHERVVRLSLSRLTADDLEGIIESFSDRGAVQPVSSYESGPPPGQLGANRGEYLEGSFVDRVNGELRRAMRYEFPVSLGIMKVDGARDERGTFSPVQKGVLKQVLKTVQAEIRSPDVARKYGPGKIGVLLPETDMESARELADRLCESVRKRLDTLASRRGTEFSLRLGLASFDPLQHPQNGANTAELLRRAEDALATCGEEQHVESRESSRMSFPEQPVRITQGDHTVEARLMNVSTGGMKVETGAELTPEEPLQIVFEHPAHPGTEVTKSGYIQWIRRPENNGDYRLGITFEDPFNAPSSA